ncbi:MAG: tripartite tricarboxylate transporter TctB family protein [Betaproteobacteria bacterium]|nr:tripartite tricarboxylate transporter TctB family protein [Betaproteobacteria bacterium]
MKVGSYRVRVEGGHLAFVGAIAAFCVWYWLDARAASTNVQNLLLIQPAAFLALALCVAIAAGTVKADRPDASAEPPGAAPSARDGRGLVVAGLLVLYVAVLLYIGFEVATFAFLAGSMYALGERRPVFLVVFSGAFAGAMSYAFKFMLSVPVPTLLF